MDNFKIIESLSKTSGFNKKIAEELILELKNNLNINSEYNDHLEFRNKISHCLEFADAQEITNFRC